MGLSSYIEKRKAQPKSSVNPTGYGLGAYLAKRKLPVDLSPEGYRRAAAGFQLTTVEPFVFPKTEQEKQATAAVSRLAKEGKLPKKPKATRPMPEIRARQPERPIYAEEPAKAYPGPVGLKDLPYKVREALTTGVEQGTQFLQNVAIGRRPEVLGGGSVLESILARTPIHPQAQEGIRRTVESAAGLAPYVLPGVRETVGLGAFVAQWPELLSRNVEGELGAVEVGKAIAGRVLHPREAVAQGELPNMLFDAAIALAIARFGAGAITAPVKAKLRARTDAIAYQNARPVPVGEAQTVARLPWEKPVLTPELGAQITRAVDELYAPTRALPARVPPPVKAEARPVAKPLAKPSAPVTPAVKPAPKPTEAGAKLYEGESLSDLQTRYNTRKAEVVRLRAEAKKEASDTGPVHQALQQAEKNAKAAGMRLSAAKKVIGEPAPIKLGDENAAQAAAVVKRVKAAEDTTTTVAAREKLSSKEVADNADVMLAEKAITFDEWSQIKRAAEAPKTVEGIEGELGEAAKTKPQHYYDVLDHIEKRLRDGIDPYKIRAGIDPTDLARLAAIGAIKIAKGALTLEMWVAEAMKDSAFTAYRAELKKVYKASRQYYKQHLEASNPAYKLEQTIRNIKRVTPEKERMYAEQRARQMAVLEEIRNDPNIPSEEWDIRAKAAMKGEFAQPEWEMASGFGWDDFYALKDRIRNSPRLNKTEALNAQAALDDIWIKGRMPQPKQSQYLAKATSPELIKAIRSNRHWMARLAERAWTEMAGGARLVLTTFDDSFALNQGSFTMVTHPVEWLKGGGKSLKAFAKEKNAVLLEEAMRKDPEFEYWQEHKLWLPERGEHVPLYDRPDPFVATLLKKVPVVKWGVRGAERAFITYGNSLRLGWAKQAKQFAEHPRSWMKLFGAKERPITAKEADGIASLANTMTGRGPLPGLEGVAHIVGGPFWSLRYLSSLLAHPLYLVHPHLPRATRLGMLKEYVQYTGLVLTALKAFDMLPGVKGETDRKSADFGKVVVGSRHYDLTGGRGAIVRYMTQFITGEYKSTRTGRVGKVFGGSRAVAGGFLRGKTTPALQTLLWDLPTGEDFLGRPMTWERAPEIAKERLLTISAQDVIDIVREEGWEQAPGIAALAFFGQRVNIYDTQDYKKKSGASLPPWLRTPGK